MINFKNIRKTEPSALESEIESLFDTLKQIPPNTEDYDKVSNQIVKLMKLKEEISSKNRISKDALTGAAANIFGILLILNYEHAHVITTKALGFVGRKIVS